MKILIIRLSSLGDVLLTTPIVRCIKTQLDDAEVFFLTKPSCAPLIRNNPYIDHVIELKEEIKESIDELKGYGIDYIVDLHNNHRSRAVRTKIGCRTYIYKKENIHKFMYVLTKHDFMSGRHVVDRYFDAVKRLGIKNDGKGLECHLPAEENMMRDKIKPGTPYVAVACGAQHFTKQIPVDGIEQLCRNIKTKVVLLGDKKDAEKMSSMTTESFDNVINLCGKTTLMQTAAIVRDCNAIITSDSAMMHIAAAFHKPTIAVWGGTAPSFGFSAYCTPHTDFVVDNISCHPCSRMGKEKCPLGHFRCMKEQNWKAIAENAENKGV